MGTTQSVLRLCSAWRNRKTLLNRAILLRVSQCTEFTFLYIVIQSIVYVYAVYNRILLYISLWPKILCSSVHTKNASKSLYLKGFSRYAHYTHPERYIRALPKYRFSYAKKLWIMPKCCNSAHSNTCSYQAFFYFYDYMPLFRRSGGIAVNDTVPCCSFVTRRSEYLSLYC